jgi:two-component system response regulator HupR/HoxA
LHPESRRFEKLVYVSEKLHELCELARKAAKTELPILVQGATGTGKELIAGEIHRRSDRASGPFVVINCGAIPENLMESELFGHVRGAFTGAIATRTGKFQQAALAGLPAEVVKRAEEILEKLIQDNDQIQLKLF